MNSAAPAEVVPRWYARILVAILALVVGFGVPGLVLALFGAFSPIAAGVIGALATAALCRAGWQLDAAAPSPGRGGSVCAVAAVVMAIGWGAANLAHVAEHVVVNRDPGVYLVAGGWLAAEGTLLVDAGTGPFGSADDVVLESAGTYDEGGQLDFQFNHLFPVLLAGAHWIGGAGLMVAVPVALGVAGLLMTFALASRLTGRAWAGLLAVTALAGCLPVLNATRDTYSEALAWPLLVGGLWAWTRAADERRPRLAVVAGCALGALVMTRVDALVYLLPVPLLGGALVAVGRANRERLHAVVLAFVLSAAPGVLLGATDLLLRSREYYRDLRGDVISVWLALLAASVLGGAISSGLAARMLGRPRRMHAWARRRLSLLAGLAAATVVSAWTLAWLVRPHLQTARSGMPFPYIGAMQAAEGQVVDPYRRYDEESVTWLAWYLGAPAVVLAIAGSGLLVARSLRRGPSVEGLAWAALAGGTALCLWRPGITPDHLWASRRLVPAALPLIAMLAALFIAATVEAVHRRARGRPGAGVAVAAALALLLVVPGAARTLPIARFSDQHGYLALVDELCSTVDGGAVLTIVGEPAGITLPQTMRSFCGVPAGVMAAGIAPSRVTELAGQWRTRNRALFVIAATPEAVATLVPGVEPTEIGPYDNDRVVVPTISYPPDRLAQEQAHFFVARVPAP